MLKQPHFSRTSIVAAADVLANSYGQTHAKFDMLILELGLDEHIRGGYLSTKALTLARLLISPPSGTFQDERIRLEVTEKVVKAAIRALPRSIPAPEWLKPAVPSDPEATPEGKLRHSLARDGFTIGDDGKLRLSLPEIANLPEADDEVHALLKRHAFDTALGHLDQAIEAHARGAWASSNSQIRSFFEAFVDDLAIRLGGNPTDLKSGQPRREFLARIGFWSSELNEWDSGGKGFFNGFIRRLHPHGSHPGLSDEEDSTFRLHLVLIIARMLIRRFDRNTMKS